MLEKLTELLASNDAIDVLGIALGLIPGGQEAIEEAIGLLNAEEPK